MRYTKKIISFLLVLALLLSTVPMSVFAVGENGDVTEENNFRFVSNGDGTCTVYGIDKTVQGEIEIPEVSPDGDVVTDIGEAAFYGFSGVTAISIPKSVITVSDFAFEDCISLETITFPQTVNRFGIYCFDGCIALKQFDVSDGAFLVTEHNGHYYTYCNMQVTWEDAKSFCEALGGHLLTVTSDDENIFISEMLKCFDGQRAVWLGGKYEGGNYHWIIGDDFTYTNWNDGEPNGDDDEPYIEMYANYSDDYDGKWNDTYQVNNPFVCEWESLPANTDAISFYVVGKEKAIVSAITKIPQGMFEGCIALETANFPETVEYIGEYAFYHCENLSNYHFETELGIYLHAFDGCKKLSDIKLPDTLHYIGENAFKDCTGLTSATISANTTMIGFDAFDGCGSLTIHCNPGSVAYGYAVDNNIPYITSGEEVPPFRYDGPYWWSSESTGYEINGNGYLHGDVVIPGNSPSSDYPVIAAGSLATYSNSITSVTFSEGIKVVYSYAFEYCPNLTDVYLPDSLTDINRYAFYSCPNITVHCSSWNTAAINFAQQNNYPVITNGECTTLSVKSLPTKTVYPLDAKLKTDGLVLAATFEDGGVRDITSGYTVDGYDFSTAGQKTITVRFAGKSTSFNVTVDADLVEYPETLHPYKANTDETWNYIHKTSAKQLEITFSDESETEGYCDYIYIYDQYGLVEELTGSFGGKKVIVDGNSFSIHMTSDYSVQYYGFEITDIRAVNVCEHNFVQTVVPPTCIDDGYTVYECSECGRTYTADTVPALGHDFINGKCTRCHWELSTIAGGTCGDGIEWLLNNAGELKITGTGDITNASWWDYKDDIVSVTVGEGINSICGYAFSNMSNLKNVSLPAGLKELGYDVFYECSKLEDIFVPASVESINNDVFYGCSRLTIRCNPGSAAEIYAVENGISYILEGDAVYYTAAFGYWSNEDGTCSVYCSNCKIASGTATIPQFSPDGDLVTYIDYQAFYGADRITKIVIPDSVTDIGSMAFNNCSSLESVNIPASVQSIANGAFGGTPVSSISVSESNPRYCVINGCLIDKQEKALLRGDADSVIPDDGSVTYIENWAFECCDDLEEIYIPAAIYSIASNVFRYCPNLVFITVDSGNERYHSSGNCIIDNYGNLVVGCTGSVIPEGVTNIDSQAFSCSGITSIIVPEGVASIDSSAFSGCSALETVVFPNSLTSIDTSAFENCTALETVIFPESLVSVGYCAFHGTAWYDSQPNELVIIGKTLYAYKGECPETLTIPEGIEIVNDYVFNWKDTLKSVEFPNTLKTIGYCAFAYCGLTEITIPESVESIEYGAFYGCEDLTIYSVTGSCAHRYALENGFRFVSIGEGKGADIALRYEDSSAIGATVFGVYDEYSVGRVEIPNVSTNGYIVTTIGKSAFENCSGLTAIVIPDTVERIEPRAFYGCSGLREIYIPKNVFYIGEDAFAGCSGIKVITVDEENNSFRVVDNCLLSNDTVLLATDGFVIPTDSNITKIANGAFYPCIETDKFSIPNRFTVIGDILTEEQKSYATILCGENSPAERYAIMNNVAYEYTEGTVTDDKKPEVAISVYETAYGYEFSDFVRYVNLSISDNINVNSYRLEYAPYGSEDFVLYKEEIVSSTTNDYSKSIYDYNGLLLDVSNMLDGKYVLRITAYDYAGNSNTDEAAFIVDTIPPEPATNLNAVATQYSIDLSWEKELYEDDFNYFIVYRSTQPDKDFQSIGYTYNTEFSDENFDTGITYYYYVACEDTYGHISEKTETTSALLPFDEIDPGITVGHLKSGSDVCGRVSFSVKVYDNINLADAKILYRLSGTEEYSTVYCEELSGKQAWVYYDWDIRNMEPGVYELRMVVSDKDGNICEEDFTYTICQYYKPVAPVLVAEYDPYSHLVRLNWTYSGNALCVEKYELHCMDDASGAYSVYYGNSAIDYYGNENSEYLLVVYDIFGETNYCTSVLFVDNQSPTIELNVSRIPTSSAYNDRYWSYPFTDGTNAKLEYSINDDYSIDHFDVEVSTDGGNTYTLFARNDVKCITKYSGWYYYGYNNTSTIDLSEFEDGKVYIRIAAYDYAHNVGYSDPVCFDIDATSPEDIADPYIYATQESIYVMWSKETLEEDFYAFYVFRSADSDDNFKLVYSGNEIGYCDENVQSGITYYYYVVCVDDHENLNDDPMILSASLYDDTTAPEVSNVAVLNGGDYCGVCNISATVTDNYMLSKLTVEYRAENENEYHQISETNIHGKKYIFTDKWDIREFEAGIYYVRYVVMDAAGNTTVTDEITCNIVAPKVELTIDYATRDKAYAYGLYYLFGYKCRTRFSISNNNFMLDKYQVQISTDYGSTFKTIKEENIESLDRNLYYDFTFDFSEYQGTVLVKVVVYDKVGKKIETEMYLFNIDTTPPNAITDFAVTSTKEYVQLSWEKRNRENDFCRFFVYRGASADGPFEKISEQTTIGYYDTAIEQNVTYYYYVTCNDIYDNTTEIGSILSGMIISDDVAPTIYDYYPASGGTYSGKIALGVSATDNYQLQYATLEYSADGIEYVAIDTKMLEGRSDIAEFSWDIRGLASGYCYVRYKVVDYVGNISYSNPIMYNIKAYTTPNVTELSYEQEHFAIRLKWNNTACNESMDHYSVYCKGPADNGFMHLATVYGSTLQYMHNVDSLGEYQYYVVAEDIFGEKSSSDTLTVTAVSFDSKKPEAVLTSDRNIYSIGWEADFSIRGTNDNDVIKEGLIDFGDGSSVSITNTINYKHTYTEPGDYSVKFTVFDRSGNSDIVVVNVSVIDPKKDTHHRVVRFTVSDEESQSIMPNTDIITINSETGEQLGFVSDDAGEVVAILPNGLYSVTAMNGDKTVMNQVLSVEPLEVPSDTSSKRLLKAYPSTENEIHIRLVLKREKYLQGSVTATEMTLEEMEAAGIDLTDPANRFVFTCKATFVFTGEEAPEPFELTYYRNANGYCFGYGIGGYGGWGAGSGGGGGWGGGYGGWGYGGYYIVPLSNPGDNNNNGNEYFLVISGEAGFTKQMFKVQLLLANTSQSDWIENCNATIKLPRGLSLASMSGDAQSTTLTVNNGKIDPNGSGSVVWYVKGDNPGSYDISVQVDGTYYPEPAEDFSKTFVTSTPIVIQDASKAIKLSITGVPRYIRRGQKITVAFNVTSTADYPLYYVTLSIDGGNKETFRVLNPGETVSVTKEITCNFGGGPNIIGYNLEKMSFVCNNNVPTEIIFDEESDDNELHLEVDAWGEFDSNTKQWSNRINSFNYAMGSFSWNIEGHDDNYTLKTNYDKVYLRISLEHRGDGFSTTQLVTSTITIKAPDGFSFSSDELVYEKQFSVERLAVGEKELISVPLYPIYSLKYADGEKLKFETTVVSDIYDTSKKTISFATVKKLEDEGEIELRNSFTTKGIKTFTYTLDMDIRGFGHSSSQYDLELAKLSASLSAATYQIKTMKSTFKNLGFSNVKLCNYNTADDQVSSNQNQVACAFATKKIIVDNKIFSVIAVAIRGTVGNEWYSNADVGYGNIHQGFFNGYVYVSNQLAQYYNELKNVTNVTADNTKMLITGHSRAGAVADLLATEVCDTGNKATGLSKNSCDQYAKTDNIYTYTFAAPNSTMLPVELFNVFNMVCETDFVPHVPGVYQRSGITMSVGDRKDAIADYIPLTVIASNINRFMRFWESCDMLQTFNKIFGSQDLNVRYSSAYSIMSFLGLDYIVIDIYDWLDNMNCTWANEPLVDMYFKLEDNLNSMGLNAKKILEPLRTKINEIHPEKRMTVGDFIVSSLILTDSPSGSEYVTDQIALFIYSNHCIESYISWLNSASKVISSANRRYFELHCPVDVEVYNGDNELICRIVSNEVVYENGCHCVVDGDRKYFMVDGENYTLKITGYDEGIMNIDLFEFDADGNVSRFVNYAGVPVVKDKSSTFIIRSKPEDGTAEYSLSLYDDTDFCATKDVTGDNIENVNVIVNVTNQGFVFGNGTYIAGQSVVLKAEEFDSEFIGWYLGDQLLSTEKIYCFVCNADVNIEARFTETLYYTISGNITSFVETDGIVTLELYDGENLIERVTADDGKYQFESVVSGNYRLIVSANNHVTRTYDVTVGDADVTQDVKIHLLGDINGDGKVNITDVNKANAHANKTKLLTGYEFDCANINGDEKVNITDVNKMNAHANKSKFLW